jgi:superfamily II DNA/RNA helicase
LFIPKIQAQNSGRRIRQFYTVSTRQGDKTTRIHQVISEKSMTKVLVFTQSSIETVHKLALVLEQLGRKGGY